MFLNTFISDPSFNTFNSTSSSRTVQINQFLLWGLKWCQVWALSHFISWLVPQSMHIFHSWIKLTHVRHKDAIKACLVEIQRERHHPPWEAKSYGRKGGVFEAWVNEALLLIWGAEERMSEWMPVMQTDIPADGSFHSKDKCYITAGASTFNNSCRLRGGAMKWIVQQHLFEWILAVFLLMIIGQHWNRNIWKYVAKQSGKIKPRFTEQVSWNVTPETNQT